jgi:hypothetical protein
MRFGTWNVWRLHRSGSLRTAAKELASYTLDLAGCRRLGGTREHLTSRELYFYGIGNENHQQGRGLCVHQRVPSDVKRTG